MAKANHNSNKVSVVNKQTGRTFEATINSHSHKAYLEDTKNFEVLKKTSETKVHKDKPATETPERKRTEDAPATETPERRRTEATPTLLSEATNKPTP